MKGSVRLVAGPFSMGSGRAQPKKEMCLSSCGPTTHKRSYTGPVLCGTGDHQRQRPWCFDPQLLNLAIGTWKFTSRKGKEPEPVQEVERYWLVIVDLTSMHSS